MGWPLCRCRTTFFAGRWRALPALHAVRWQRCRSRAGRCRTAVERLPRCASSGFLTPPRQDNAARTFRLRCNLPFHCCSVYAAYLYSRQPCSSSAGAGLVCLVVLAVAASCAPSVRMYYRGGVPRPVSTLACCLLPPAYRLLSAINAYRVPYACHMRYTLGGTAFTWISIAVLRLHLPSSLYLR